MSTRPALGPLGEENSHALPSLPEPPNIDPMSTTATTTATTTTTAKDEPRAQFTASTPVIPHFRYDPAASASASASASTGSRPRGTDMENSNPPKFHPPPPMTSSRPLPPLPPQQHQHQHQHHPNGSSPYTFFQAQAQHYPMAYSQPGPFVVPHSHPHPHPHPHPFADPMHMQQQQQHQQQHRPRHPQTPYNHSPTPTLTYSPYDMSQMSAMSMSGPGMKKPSTTPTPSSRAYRSYPSGSSKQCASETPCSVKTPFHRREHDNELGTPASSAEWPSDSERILIPKPEGMPRPFLSGIEPNAPWSLEDGPPRHYLEGEDGKEVIVPENMTRAEADRYTKIAKDTNKFRSHNPWDYIAPDSRQQFSPSQRMLLESLWTLTSTPTPKERERISVWMGVSTSRITIFFQNRRQGIVKMRDARNPKIPKWQSSPDDRVCDQRAWWASGPVHGAGMMASSEDEQYYGMVRLNPERGFLDDNGKWTYYIGDDIPLPPAEYMEKLPILYTITRGRLDHLLFYDRYKLAQASGSGSDSSPLRSYSPARLPAEGYNAQMPTRWFDAMMQDREAGIPASKRNNHRIPLEYDERGNVKDLADFLPTDPPSEGPAPVKPRPSNSQKRGERCPEFAMRATSPVQFGRASGRNVFWSSQRAQALASAAASASSAGTGTTSLGRTQSLPATHRPRPQPLPLGRIAPNVSHTTLHRPSIDIRPKRSFARSQSAADVGSPLPKSARLVSDANGRCGVRTGMSNVSEGDDEEEDEEEEGPVMKKSRGETVDDITAAEALLGFSQSSASASGSGSRGESRSPSRD